MVGGSTLKILVAKNSGFCFGVKQAINKALDIVKVKGDKNIFTYGPLIHNTQVIEEMRQKGIIPIGNLEEAKDSIIIIRSHGVGLELYELAKNLNIEIIDATCPFVRKVQNIAREYCRKDYKVVIIGDPNHPEVIGINGWCNNDALIVDNKDKVKNLPIYEKLCVVAQTTITNDKWENITSELKNKGQEVREFNTICLATKERQDSCAKVAEKVDYMIVIGGYHSSNTQKLYKIAKQHCENTLHIETSKEINLNDFDTDSIIGITAGASTPEWIINDVIKKIESKGGV